MMHPTNSSVAFVFPGQGSQTLGMLSRTQPLKLVEHTFREASQALNKDLWALAQSGPDTLLNETINTQPVLLTASVALWQVWQHHQGCRPQFLAGHSLGEYSALVCAQAITLSDAVKLVQERGRLMQEATNGTQVGMAAVLGLSRAEVEAACESVRNKEIISAVNFNSPEQTVIAGHESALNRAMDVLKEKGAKRVIKLPVSVASHCDLMRPIAKAFEDILANVRIQKPQISIIHNVDVKSAMHPDDIRTRLVSQLYSPVRWVETIEYLAQQNIKFYLECGPGKVLSGLSKRINTELNGMPLEKPDELEAALAACVN